MTGKTLFPLVFYLMVPIFIMSHSVGMAKKVELRSPDKKIRVDIHIRKNITYSIQYQNQPLLLPSPISMSIKKGSVLGINPKLVRVKRRKVREEIRPLIPEKRRIIPNQYNEAQLQFRNHFGLIFRAYNDGVAYRFTTEFSDSLYIASEQVSFSFPHDRFIYFPFEDDFLSHSERLYLYVQIHEITAGKMGCVPVLICGDNGPSLVITEADLDEYPGMYLTGSSSDSTLLQATFPAYPLSEKQVGDRTVKVTERADYLAHTSGTREFPWRVVMIAECDKDLLLNDLVFRLGPSQKISDGTWIQPGKVAWDWWNALNLYGVDFRAGVNTATYKYYIDFAAENNLEYIILDEGWSDPADLFKLNPEVDMEEIISYAHRKGVGVILWCVWLTLDRQFQAAFDQFERWGIQGIKVDFMQRDDQKMVNFYHRVAREAARRHLLVDFHGAYKPTGLRRAFPNVITREGVRGLEHSKWSKDITPNHDLILPFTRMLAGPMDFTPGAMVNATKKQFAPIFDRPMSQGTRCHQLAMYVIYESPLQMLCDSPSNYRREPEIMAFLSRVPTIWDDTIILDARVAEYILLARKSQNDWYVGAMTNWTPRTLTLNLSFLEKKKYHMDIYQDGINADRNAIDYKMISREVSNSDKIPIRLAPGGGWVARIYEESK